MNHEIALDDKYTRREGYAYMKGIQALARVMLEQQWRDRAAGHNTAGIVSGYRGSPLGAFDHVMAAAKSQLDSHNIHFTPGLNEDLAANIVWGAQQVTLFPSATRDGVYGMWYGKGPGVDRCGDVFKHGNSSGSSRLGGVLCIAGDDHNAESSTIPHQTEDEFISAGMPVIFPAGVKEFIEFGLFGLALSRYSGCWVGFTAETECVESGAVVSLAPVADCVVPKDHPLPPFSLNNSVEDHDRQTPAQRLEYYKLPAVHAFARANRIDRMIFDSPDATIGIISAGKTYLDVCEALEFLGIDEAKARSLGIRLYKIGLTWPLEPEGIRTFARGLQHIIVVEEKRSLIEWQLKTILYDQPGPHPRVLGKKDESGAILFQSHNAMTSLHIAQQLAAQLTKISVPLERAAGDGLPAMLQAMEQATVSLPQGNLLNRRPFYCSGCPHNRSTLAPEGSRVLAGIGCHTMAMWMPRHTDLMPQMGGEGAGWIGQHRFTTEKHMFVNLGDGSYSHSGSMAIRAAVAENVNITYKILFNDAVAMTGGQAIESHLTVPILARQLLAEGVNRVCVVSKEPEQYPQRGALPEGTELFPRQELMAVQASLRDTAGVTALVYDQTCAAELRRRRKRGEAADPPLRAFINHRVCEGCGDCSKASNCISIEPRDTSFGRKRQINQASCNKDITCTEGFCPSFVLIKGGDVKREAKAHGAFDARMAAQIASLAEPVAVSKDANLLICGTGGTGVITLGAILGVAATLDGKFMLGLDQTGLAQKGGTTASHVRISARDENRSAARIPVAGADTLMGCDLVVAASLQMLERVRPDHTRVILNDHLSPVADFVENNDTVMDAEALICRIQTRAGEQGITQLSANRLAEKLFGDTLYTNMMLLGFALQAGCIPLSLGAIKRAVELNRVDVEQNLKALNFGRLLCAQPEVAQEIDPPEPAEAVSEIPLQQRIETLAAELAAYQNTAYALRYRQWLEQARSGLAEKGVDDSTGVLRIIAENAYRLMAYKDEYEVARLYTSGSFMEEVQQSFSGGYRLEFLFAPPWTRAGDRPRKLSFGPWMMPMLKVFARMRAIRGSAIDPLGYSAERRMERQLIADYRNLVARVIEQITPERTESAARLLAFPQVIRGFGHVKRKSLTRAHAAAQAAWENFSATPTPLPAFEWLGGEAATGGN